MRHEGAHRSLAPVAERRPALSPGDHRIGGWLRSCIGAVSYRLAPRLTTRMAFARHWHTGSVEPELYLVPALGDRGRRAVDVGAARGLFAFVMARHFAAVQAFEPDPSCLRDLAARMPDNVECRAELLSNWTGETELPIDGRAGIGADAMLPPDASGCMRRVRLAKLDDQPRHLPVGLVKIDACGRELAICQGAERTLRRDRPVLLVEAEGQCRPDAMDELGDFLLTRGYLGFVLARNEVVSLERRSSRTSTLERQAVPMLTSRGRHLLFLPEDRVPTLLPRLRRAMIAAPRRARRR